MISSYVMNIELALHCARKGLCVKAGTFLYTEAALKLACSSLTWTVHVTSEKLNLNSIFETTALRPDLTV